MAERAQASVNTSAPTCLIIADGSIATLVAVWREAVCRPGGGGANADSQSSRPVLWSPAGISGTATAANNRIAQAAGLTSPIAGPLPAAIGGLAASLMLMAAGDEGARRGIGRVVWPVQLAASDEQTRLTQVGGVFDRALLVARLLSVDTRQSNGQSVLVHTPFAELSDTQLLDLAADMDAPVGAAAWCDEQQPGQPACGTCAACVRWISAMKLAGIVAPIAQLPASLLEDKPALEAVV